LKADGGDTNTYFLQKRKTAKREQIKYETTMCTYTPSEEKKYETSSKQRAATCFTLVSCLVYSLTLKLEATRSSKTLADSQQTT
jgi:hypothetical protein